MRNVILSALTLLVCSVGITAQVTIGSLQEPRAGAGLDLNSNSKGLLLPNVSLFDPATAFQLDGGDPAKAKGMTVYNTSNNLNGPGVYVWDGKQWILITCEPETPGTITLSATTVNLNGTFTASVPEVTTGTQIPTSYTWTLPSGLTGTSTTRSITITGATAGDYAVGTIKVMATNACGTSAAQSSASAVTVRACSAAPATPGTITLSATTVNLNGTFTASVPEVTTGTQIPTSYTWTLSSGLTGTSTTRTITITGATAGDYAVGTIKVTATNACGTSAAQSSASAVTVRACSAAPATPGTITLSATTVKQSSTFTAFVPAVTGTTAPTSYTWTVPSGLTITGTATGRSITITGTTANTYAVGTIKVTATNDCGTSAAQSCASAVTVIECSSLTVGSITYSVGLFGTAGCWMTQNLRTTTGLTANSSPGTNSKYYWYPNNSSSTYSSNPTYGLLYTWAAASGRTSISADEGNSSSQTRYQGICPTGWHLPSDYEWGELTSVISASTDGAYSTTTTTGTTGTKIKSTTAVNGQATNGTSKARTANGFDALLVGGLLDGTVYGYGSVAYFWSSSSYAEIYAYRRSVDSGTTSVTRGGQLKYSLFSVRCKKN
jgi:uncharacterized protein (TIGR02145 family)